MKKSKVFRQGDVLIVPIETKTRGKDVREKGRTILAHGEATGHAHEVIGSKVSFEEVLVDGLDVQRGSRILRVGRTAKLKHQEHTEITIPPGTYQVIRQREYSPESIRNVAD